MKQYWMLVRLWSNLIDLQFLSLCIKSDLNSQFMYNIVVLFDLLFSCQFSPNFFELFVSWFTLISTHVEWAFYCFSEMKTIFKRFPSHSKLKFNWRNRVMYFGNLLFLHGHNWVFRNLSSFFFRCNNWTFFRAESQRRI